MDIGREPWGARVTQPEEVSANIFIQQHFTELDGSSFLFGEIRQLFGMDHLKRPAKFIFRQRPQDVGRRFIQDDDSHFIRARRIGGELTSDEGLRTAKAFIRHSQTLAND